MSGSARRTNSSRWAWRSAIRRLSRMMSSPSRGRPPKLRTRLQTPRSANRVLYFWRSARVDLTPTSIFRSSQSQIAVYNCAAANRIVLAR